MRLPSMATVQRVIRVALDIKDAITRARQKEPARPYGVDRALRDHYTTGEYKGGYAPPEAPRIPDDGKL